MSESVYDLPSLKHLASLTQQLDEGMVSVQVEEVEKTLSKVQEIREAISDLASIEDKALLQSFGLEEETKSSSSESEEEGTMDNSEEGS